MGEYAQDCIDKGMDEPNPFGYRKTRTKKERELRIERILAQGAMATRARACAESAGVREPDWDFC